MSLAREYSSSGYSVGICATGDAPQSPELVRRVLEESPPPGLSLRRVVVVASECSAETLAAFRQAQASDSRVALISEDRRQGKARAINHILDLAEGQLLVLVNSDAHPEPGSFRELLTILSSNDKVGVVSAMPVVPARDGMASILADLMWTTHNECSLTLNHLNLSNHSSDELVALRLDALSTLPPDTVNDGAYLAATARSRGFSVKFSTSAKVRIETPGRVSDLIAQRRRILFGHAQVWKAMGSPPRTMESLLFLSPAMGLKLFVRAVSRKPRFLLVLPAAVVTELAAAGLAVIDRLRSTQMHVIWRRFD